MIDGLAHVAYTMRTLFTLQLHTLRKPKRADSSFKLWKLVEMLGRLKSLYLVHVVASG
jgi:hypothetical protein